MPDRLIGVLIAAFFGIGTLVAGMRLRDRLRRLRRGTVVTAHIVGKGDSGGYGSWYTVVYRVRGAPVEGKVSQFGVPRAGIGSTIEVAYDPERPERVVARQRLDGRIDTTLIWALLVLGSAICALAAVGLASG